MKKYRLAVFPLQTMRIDTDGEWDRTFETSFGWTIEEEEGVTVKGGRGFATFEEAKEAGEKELRKLEEYK